VIRLLSYTEITKALTCPAQWDFAYGGHLAGSALKPKATAPTLQAGRAWGAAVAAWHASATTSLLAYADAVSALCASLNDDAERQRRFGLYDPVGHRELEQRLLEILQHYVATTEPEFSATRLEEEVVVPIPSRGGRRSSNRYAFVCYFDAVSDDYRPGENWLLEYKLRSKFFSVALIANSRQLRWYAWAHQRKLGIPIHGVLTEERLHEHPHPARLVKSKRKQHEFLGGEYPLVASHATDQITTPELYVEACRATYEEPQPHVIDALGQRRWLSRVPVQFRPGELAEAGRELVSAAKRIRNLDSGDEYPIRNVRPANCNSCTFREICPEPDSALVDATFERTVPKRNRPPLEEAAKEAIAA
jgi:CRISPR/Cas system-associated exonuclease Cas4 (RecB family)